MRVAIYADQERFESGFGDTAYLYEALDEHFPVSLFWRPDAELCAAADVVFIRFSRSRPPPARFLEDLAGLRDKLFVNPPESLIQFGTKRHLRRFPDLTVPTIVTRSHSAILGMAKRYGPIVLKPLDGSGGRGVVKVDVSSMSRRRGEAAVAYYIALYGTPVVQPFIDRVQDWGDKRINVLGYEVISVVRTLPGDDSFICHRSAGGREVAASLSDDDERILREVVPFLREHGIWWAGIDVIGPYLGEINVVSPMMIRRADVAHGDARGRDAMVRLLREYADRHGR